MMVSTHWAMVRNGRVELLEPVNVPDGTRAWVTLLSEDQNFWLRTSLISLNAIWDNPEDDIYEQLLTQ